MRCRNVVNLTIMSEALVASGVGASRDKSAPWLVWCPWVFFKWRYNAFNLSRDLTRPLHRGVIQILTFIDGSSLRHATTLTSYVTISIVIVEICFLIYHMNVCLKVYVNLWVEASHCKLPPCRVWWPLAWCKWRYTVFNLSRELKRPPA